MKIFKYTEFINEDNYQDPPEEYVKIRLMKLKKKIESFFEDAGSDDNNGMTMDKAIENGKTRKKDESKLSFKEMNVELESSELSKYSAIYDSLTVKFSDPEFMYNLFITIPLDSAINKDKEKDFSDKEIKECSIKFKKYDVDDFDLIGQIGPKTVKIDDIDEEFLVELKIELDDEFSIGDEKLELET